MCFPSQYHLTSTLLYWSTGNCLALFPSCIVLHLSGHVIIYGYSVPCSWTLRLFTVLHFFKIATNIPVLFSLPIQTHRIGFCAVTTSYAALGCLATLPSVKCGSSTALSIGKALAQLRTLGGRCEGAVPPHVPASPCSVSSEGLAQSSRHLSMMT